MIVASAIRTYLEKPDYPIIWTGKRHADIFENMIRHGIKYDRMTLEQGFYTDDGQFLNRYDAKNHAIACRQITSSEFAELFSEDLWPE